MPRFLFVSIPASGHVNPTLPIVQALMERGNVVGYATGPNMEQTVRPLVTQFLPVGPDASAEAIQKWWPEMGKLRGLKRLNFMIREVMFPFAASVAQEVLDVTASFQPGRARLRRLYASREHRGGDYRPTLGYHNRGAGAAG